MESERVEAAMAAQNKAGLVLRHRSRGDGECQRHQGDSVSQWTNNPSMETDPCGSSAPSTHPRHLMDPRDTSWVLSWRQPHGMGWIRIPAGTHQPCWAGMFPEPSLSPPAQLRAESPAGAAVAGKSSSTVSPGLAPVNPSSLALPCQHCQPNPT